MKIKLATIADSDAIKKFIKINWSKKNHIFTKNDLFYNYEMCPFKKPNFAIALKDSKIIGILGFTLNRDRIKDSDLFLVMFRVIKFHQSYAAGVELIKFVSKLTNAGIHTIGANEKILAYYKFLGFRVGWLNHYYWLSNNPIVQKFFNKKNHSKQNTLINKKYSNENSKLVELNKANLISENLDLNKSIFHKLIKSKNFFLRRYFQHPIYNYSFFKSRTFNGVGVVRKVNVKGFIGWRIIDWYGDLEYFYKFCKLLVETANQNNVAFLDLYVSGIRKEKLISTGLKKISNSVVIPNHLEPLVLKNIKISFVTSYKDDIFFIRGDGDQDRPS
jgi:hypothetical protein